MPADQNEVNWQEPATQRSGAQHWPSLVHEPQTPPTQAWFEQPRQLVQP
jgi:hypothetical protein